MKKILAFCLSIAFVFGAFCMPVSASPVIEEGISVYINDESLIRIKDNQRGIKKVSEWIGDENVLSHLAKMKYSSTVHGLKYSCVS
ncbi:MAG: hypothetical protein RR957_00225 [Oscillospiraceae bacterium]